MSTITIGELRDMSSQCIRTFMNQCERNPLFDGVNSRLSANNFSGSMFRDTVIIAGGFAHYLISQERMHPNAAVETASKVIYDGTLAVVGMEAPEHIRNGVPGNTVGWLRNARDTYTKAVKTLDDFARQQQQQNNGWGNNQNQGTWGNQQQNNGWGNQQQSNGWNNPPQQSNGWGGQNNGWSNNNQDNGWNNQPQQNNGWGTTQNSMTHQNNPTRGNGFGFADESAPLDPFDLAADVLGINEPQQNQNTQQSQPRDNDYRKVADDFFTMIDSVSATPPQEAAGETITVGGVTYRKENTSKQSNATSIPWKDTRESLMEAGLKSSPQHHSEPDSAWGKQEWDPMRSSHKEEVEEDLLPSATLPKSVPLAEAPEAYRKQTIKDSPHRACPLYNIVKQKPYVTAINPKTGEIVMRRIDNLKLNYEDHESELIVPMSTRVDTSPGDVKMGSKTLARASLHTAVEDYRKSIADNKDPSALPKIISESPMVTIEPYVTAGDISEYWSAATVKLSELGVESSEYDVDKNIINYNAVKNGQFLISGEAREFIGSALRARTAHRVVEHILDFQDCEHTLPRAEINRLHENATKLLNIYLETHFEPDLTVTSWLNDFEELAEILTTDYPGDNTSRMLNHIYTIVARDTFGGFDEVTLKNRGLDPEDFGMGEGQILLAQVKNVTLLPCRYADIPFGFVGKYGVVTQQSNVELYEVFGAMAERNPSIITFSLITVDNVELKFYKSAFTSATGETVYYIAR